MNRLHSYIVFLISTVIIGFVSYFFNEIISGESTIERFLLFYTSFTVIELFYNSVFTRKG